MKVKAGDVVECDFLDHVEDGEEALSFTVWGRIESVTRQRLIIVSWAYQDGVKRGDHNEKRWVIVRSAITAIYPLIRSGSINKTQL